MSRFHSFSERAPASSVVAPGVIRLLLERAGYRFAWRESGFFECLVSSDKERWLGRGLTSDEALADCFEQMLPSALARHLLAQALVAQPVSVPPDLAQRAPRAPSDRDGATPATASAHAPAPGADAAPPPPEPAPEPGPELVDPGPLPRALTQGVVPLETRIGHRIVSPTIPMRPTLDAPYVRTANGLEAVLGPTGGAGTGSGSFARPSPDNGGTTQQRLKTSAAPPPPPVPSRRADDDIAELEILDERLRALLPELAGFSRELQRLGFIAFIARARHIGFRTADARVDQLVRRIAGRLGELAQQFWPGSVRALQIRATPLQAGADMGLPDGGKLHDWAEAAETAERLVEERRAQLVEDRLDEWGWADYDRCYPPPNDADARLEQVRNAMEKLFGKLDHPSSTDTDRELQTAGDKHVAELTRWARELRWLRPHVEDRVRWGQAFGRLRWAVTRLQRELRPQLEVALDELHRPQKVWAAELGEDPVAKQKKKLRKALLQKRPEGENTDPALVSEWLAEAFELGDAFSTSEIAERIPDWHAIVLALPSDESTEKDRKYRRRLKLLQDEIDRRIRGVTEEAPPADGEGEPVPTGEPDEGDLAFRRLLEKVREKVAGKSALFVSNRADPLLKEKLEKELGLEIEWAEIDPRRIQARIESVRQRSFDMVLSATGFQGHSIDATLGRETRACGLPYVRVNRGRLTTCVRAIARQFGLLEAA